MNQIQRRQALIRGLLAEQPSYRGAAVPANEEEQRRLLRSLMNVRRAAPVEPELLKIQDEYLQEENRRRGAMTLAELTPMEEGLYLWRGDITRLACGAIVNAANSGMTGCYQPCHMCIDNCIHTFAGLQLRNYCNDLMEQQGYPEPTGQAKITPAFNLPCDYVIHTVGPIVDGRLTQKHRRQLADCYQACLALAEENAVDSIAFCCISTGVFRFPREEAARIAVDTVRAYRAEKNSSIQVIFNVHNERDEEIYRSVLI
jgi:O-acetyl-ADP-ribose deacetylase (regulator of RNase III)